MSKVLFKKIKNKKYSPVKGIERNIKIVFFTISLIISIKRFEFF